MTVEACLHLLVLVDFYVCSNLLLRILPVARAARAGQGTPAFLGQVGNSSHFVDFAIPVLLSERREVLEMRGGIEHRTKLLPESPLSAAWLFPPFTKEFLVYFLGSIDFAVNYKHTENRNGG